MLYKYLISILIILKSIYSMNINTLPDPELCEKRLFEECNHKSVFTSQEIENARLFIQNKMMNEASIKPKKPPCAKINVRQDWKCMTEADRQTFISIIRQLYLEGDMDELTDIHSKYWPLTHKTAEIGPWHSKHIFELEKRIMKKNPLVTVPYWAYPFDFSHPNKSMVWKYFGHSGNHYNGYCVTDGMYANLPVRRCIKRHWYNDLYMPPWESTEISTFWLQTDDYNILMSKLLGFHFLMHLSIGGYNGEMSVSTAPYDIVFYLCHNYLSEVIFRKNQLSYAQNLTPKSYNSGLKIDQATGSIRSANIIKDKLAFYEDTSPIDLFHIGYGEYCSVTDQVIENINNIITNKKVPVPIAIQRMPIDIKFKYYPKIFFGNYTVFDHSFTDVGDCNPIGKCKPIPRFEKYMETENGRRQVARYRYDEALDLQLPMIVSNEVIAQLNNDLNQSNYCSPYVV